MGLKSHRRKNLTLAVPGSRRGDDDLAADVSFLQVAQARGGVGQRVGPVDDRCELPGLDELGDGEQVFPRPGVRERSEPLSDETVGNDHAEDSRYRAEQMPG